MKIEDKVYVLMKVGNMDIKEETVYFSNNDDDRFVNDIRQATKYKDRGTALIDRTDYEVWHNKGMDSGLQVVPLKITYEW